MRKTVAGSAAGVVASRSYWQAPIAMAAAVAVTGGAIAAAPVAPAVGALAAEVALTAFADPLGAVVGTVLSLSNDLFNGLDIYSSYPWEPYQGLLPEFIYTALPIVSQLGFNGLNYIGGSIEALGTVTQLLTGAVWGLPGAVVTAVGQAVGGDLPGALTTLANATIVPIQTAGTIALDAGIAVLGGVAYNLTNLVVSIPGIIGGLVASLQGGLFAIAGAAGQVVTQTIGALATLNLEGAWNVLVNGLLGPVGADGLVTSSIPGTVLAVTVGPGVGPLGPGSGYAVQSLRMWGEQSQLAVANALGANFPITATDVAEVSAAAPAPAPAGRGTALPAAAATPAAAAPSASAGEQTGGHGGDAAPTVSADRTPASSAAAPQSAADQTVAESGDNAGGGHSKQRASRTSGRGAAGGATAGTGN